MLDDLHHRTFLAAEKQLPSQQGPIQCPSVEDGWGGG
jgi:hypothetical protein